MAGVRYAEWLNRNSAVAFPFREDSDFRAGGLLLPKSAFLDASVVLDGVGRGDVVLEHLSSAEVSCTAFFSSPAGRFSVSWDGPSLRVSSLPGARVRMYVGDVPPAGEYEFDNPPALLDSRVAAFPDGVGVSSLECGGVSVTGDVELADGHGTSLSVENGAVRLRIGRNVGLAMPCPPSVVDGGDGLLYYLNGQKADPDGSMTVHSGAGTSVSTGVYRREGDGLEVPAVFVSTDRNVDGFVYAK